MIELYLIGLFEKSTFSIFFLYNSFFLFFLFIKNHISIIKSHEFHPLTFKRYKNGLN